MTNPKIDVAPNIDGFFEQAVHDAVRVQRVDATQAAQHYLALLLGDFARGSQLAASIDQPLMFQLGDALAATGAERFTRLQRIGDGVLYALGFFGDAFTKRGADPHYAMSIGSSAYGHAAAMLKLSGGGGAPDVFGELADRFDRFVAVVSEVADGVLATNADDVTSVLRLYNRWEKTHSDRLATELAHLGVCPVRGAGGVH